MNTYHGSVHVSAAEGNTSSDYQMLDELLHSGFSALPSQLRIMFLCQTHRQTGTAKLTLGRCLLDQTQIILVCALRLSSRPAAELIEVLISSAEPSDSQLLLEPIMW